MLTYHHYVSSPILPDAEREYLCMEKTPKALQKENEAFKKESEIHKKKGAFLTSDAEQFKAERQRVPKVIRNRDHQRNQLMHCKNELSVLGKKIGIQEMDLRRGHKQNEALKEELQSMRKELQSVKQAAVKQRTEQQNLKEQLDQVVKERDGLNDKWQRCKNECSELQLKFKRCRTVGDLVGKNKLLIQQKPSTPLIRKSSQVLPLPSTESLQNELLTQNEELRKTQKLCEELKQSLTQMAVYVQQCRVTVRDQKERLKAVTAERNMYKSEMEKLAMELTDIKMMHRSEKQWNKATRRTKKVKLSSGDKSSQSDLPRQTGNKLSCPISHQYPVKSRRSPK